MAALALALMFSASTACAEVFINIISNAITLTPTPSDYANDSVEATGLAGIRIKVKTNSPTGMLLMVRSGSGTPAIALADLLVRTMTAPGPGGFTLTAYTPLGLANLNLWSTAVSQAPFYLVDTDVRIRNLFNYDDAPSAGTTSYTNTLIFTVVAQ